MTPNIIIQYQYYWSSSSIRRLVSLHFGQYRRHRVSRSRIGWSIEFQQAWSRFNNIACFTNVINFVMDVIRISSGQYQQSTITSILSLIEGAWSISILLMTIRYCHGLPTPISINHFAINGFPISIPLLRHHASFISIWGCVQFHWRYVYHYWYHWDINTGLATVTIVSSVWSLLGYHNVADTPPPSRYWYHVNTVINRLQSSPSILAEYQSDAGSPPMSPILDQYRF